MVPSERSTGIASRHRSLRLARGVYLFTLPHIPRTRMTDNAPETEINVKRLTKIVGAAASGVSHFQPVMVEKRNIGLDPGVFRPPTPCLESRTLAARNSVKHSSQEGYP